MEKQKRENSREVERRGIEKEVGGGVEGEGEERREVGSPSKGSVGE